MKAKDAIAAIEKHGLLLVYPINNRKEPRSLWSVFYPRSEMRWEWDESGDSRVSNLWHLREELSRSNKVVYAKWYQGRATFFSRDVFSAMARILGAASREAREQRSGLSHEAGEILQVLEMDSPLSTKQIKLLTDLRGRAHEATYERAMKELWRRLLIVGYGEVQDGAFPSLAVGATRVLFEDLWERAGDLSLQEAWEKIQEKLDPDSAFLKFLKKAEAGPRILSSV